MAANPTTDIILKDEQLIVPELKEPPKSASKRERETFELLKAFRDVAVQMATEMGELKSWDDFLTEVGATTSSANLLQPQYKIPISPAVLRDLYKNHPWVYIAINAVSRVIAGLPVVVKQTKRVQDDEGGYYLETVGVDSHPFLDVINNPNDKIKDTKYQFLWRLIIEILATGQAYIWVRKTSGELEIIHNELLKPIVNVKGELDGYESVQKNKGRPNRFDTDEIIDIRLPNPFNALDGMSPIIAGILPILIRKYQDEFQVTFYLSGGRKPSILTNKGNTSIKQLMVIARSFENMFIGRGKGNKTVALPKDVDHKELGTSQQEQALKDLMGMSRDDILAVFRIPPSEAGILDDASYANAALMSRDFWEKMAIPFMRFITDAFNTSVYFKTNREDKTRVAGERIFMDFDLSKVAALQEDAGKRTDSLNKRNWLTLNEKREADGLEALDGELYDIPWVELEARLKAQSQPAPILPAEIVAGLLPKPKDEPGEAKEFAEAKPVDYEKDQRVSRLSNLVEVFAVDREARVKRYLKQWQEAAINAVYETLEGKRKGKKVKAYHQKDTYIDFALLQNPIKTFKTKWMQEPMPGLNLKQADELNEILRLLTDDAQAFRDKYLDDYEKDLLPAYRIGYNETIIGTSISGVADEDIIKDLRATGVRQTSAMDDTTIRDVRKILADEFEKGDATARTLAASIKDLFAETYKNRSLTVARHEIYSTVAGGEIKGQETIDKIYPDAKKTWNHGGNFDAREHHKAADKILKADIKGYFTLTTPEGKTVKLRSPRDPNAPIGETINCGCYVTYELGEQKQT